MLGALILLIDLCIISTILLQSHAFLLSTGSQLIILVKLFQCSNFCILNSLSGLIKRGVSYKQSRVYENSLTYYRDLIVSAPKTIQDGIKNKLDSIKQDFFLKKQKTEETISSIYDGILYTSDVIYYLPSNISAKVDNTISVINSAKDELSRTVDDTIVRVEETKLFIVQLPIVASTKVDNSIAKAKSTQQKISSQVKETIDFVVYLPSNVTAKVEEIRLQAIEIKDNAVVKVETAVAQAVSVIEAIKFTYSVVQEIVQTKNITAVNKLFPAQKRIVRDT